MDWLEVGTVVGSLVVTLVGCGALGVRFIWRKTDKVRDELGREIAGVRKESREAHEKIGDRIGETHEKIDKVRDDLRIEIGQVKDDLRIEIGQMRDRLIGEVRQLDREMGRVGGKLEGVQDALKSLQEDFRAYGVDRQAT